MLLALIHVVLVLASRGRFDALAIDKIKLRKVRVSALSAQIVVCDQYIPRRIRHSPPAGQRHSRCTDKDMDMIWEGRVEQKYRTYHLLEMRLAEDGVVDLDCVCGVSHG
jgi:hypothetical protein